MQIPTISGEFHNQITTAFLFSKLKIDQIAFACHTEDQEINIKEALGLADKEWIEDECVAFGRVGIGRNNVDPGSSMSRNRAKLLFNYDLGIEVEILRYLGGPNYLGELGFRKGVCHLGMHVEKGTPLSDAETVAGLFKADIAQQVLTESHTNEFLLKSGRRYRYTIFDTTKVLGTCLKVIERIEKDSEE